MICLHNTDKILFMLSIAAKAGKTSCGSFLAETAIKKNKAKLVIIADDASDNTKKQFNNMASYRKVPVLEYGTKSELGHFTGNEERSVVAVTDINLANGIKDIVDKTKNG